MGITSTNNNDAEFSSVSLADDGVNEPPIQLRLVAATETNGFDHEITKDNAAIGRHDPATDATVDVICKLAHTIDIAGVTAGLKVETGYVVLCTGFTTQFVHAANPITVDVVLLPQRQLHVLLRMDLISLKMVRRSPSGRSCFVRYPTA